MPADAATESALRAIAKTTWSSATLRHMGASFGEGLAAKRASPAGQRSSPYPASLPGGFGFRRRHHLGRRDWVGTQRYLSG